MTAGAARSRGPGKGQRPPELDAVLAAFRAEPSRTWSLVVTVFGDAVVPRGGSLWLGTLLAFCQALGIGDGAVRTAMSRLTADGWLERSRMGRRSFYRLGARGRATFEAAAQRIYGPLAAGWDGGLSLVLTGREPEGDEAAALAAAGFGSALPGLWVAPSGIGVPAEAAGGLVLRAQADADAGRRLAASAWPLDRTAEAYRGYIAAFHGLQDALAAGAGLSDADAMVARILSVHAYRRAVLRDPRLPLALLPADWPADEARRLCRDLYRSLLEPSERWLDAHGLTEAGPLPPAEPTLSARFTT